MNCPDPIDVSILADYWIGVLADTEAEAVEVHLLCCDECGARLREVIALAEAVRSLAREGSLRMVVSDRFVERMKQDGLCVREYQLNEGDSVQCTVTAEDDMLVARLAADLQESARVDLCLCDRHGLEQARLMDIPAKPGAAGIVLQESILWAKELPSTEMRLRLVRRDDAGAEQLLGEYTFHHTRSMPGPGTS